jgi:hypothetical protein
MAKRTKICPDPETFGSAIGLSASGHMEFQDNISADQGRFIGLYVDAPLNDDSVAIEAKGRVTITAQKDGPFLVNGEDVLGKIHELQARLDRVIEAGTLGAGGGVYQFTPLDFTKLGG